MEEFGNCAEKKHYRDCKYIKNSVETYNHFLTNVCKNPYNKGIHLYIVYFKYKKEFGRNLQPFSDKRLQRYSFIHCAHFDNIAWIFK